MTSTVPSNSPSASVLEGVPGPLIPGTGHEARIGADAQAVTTRYWQYGECMGSGSFPEGCYPVLLVHGFRGDHHGLEIIANYLLKLIPNVSIISPDLPGFGRSGDLPENALDEDSIDAYVAWLQDFVERTNPLGLPLHVVGHPHQRLRGGAPCLARAPLTHQPHQRTRPGGASARHLALGLALLPRWRGTAREDRLPVAAFPADYPPLQRGHDAHQR